MDQARGDTEELGSGTSRISRVDRELDRGVAGEGASVSPHVSETALTD